MEKATGSETELFLLTRSDLRAIVQIALDEAHSDWEDAGRIWSKINSYIEHFRTDL